MNVMATGSKGRGDINLGYNPKVKNLLMVGLLGGKRGGRGSGWRLGNGF